MEDGLLGIKTKNKFKMFKKATVSLAPQNKMISHKVIIQMMMTTKVIMMRMILIKMEIKI